MSNSFIYKEYFLETISDVNFHLIRMLPHTEFLREDYNDKILRRKINLDSKDTRTYVAYVYSNEIIVAFSLFDICKIDNNKLLHMRLVVTDPKVQSKGAYRFLFEKRLERHSPSYLIGRFHNPRVYENLFKLESTIYPDTRITSQKKPPNWILKLLQKYAETNEYDSRYSVAKNIYVNKREILLNAKDTNINNYYLQHVGVYDALVVFVILKTAC